MDAAVPETLMGVVQRIRNFNWARTKDCAGNNARISRVVSKSDRDHGTATTDNRTLGLTPVGTISHSNLSLGLYPFPRPQPVVRNLVVSPEMLILIRPVTIAIKTLFLEVFSSLRGVF